MKKKIALYLLVLLTLNLYFINTLAQAEEGTDVETIEVTVSGMGAITEEGIADARKAAINDALKLAVEQARGVMVSSNTEVNNFVIVKDDVLSKCRGYVKNYRILDENKLDKDKAYRVSIVANVALRDPKLKAQITFDEKTAKQKMPAIFDEIRALSNKTNQLAELIDSKDTQNLRESGFEGLLPRYKTLIQVLSAVQLPEERMKRFLIFKKGVLLKASATLTFKEFLKTRDSKVFQNAVRLNRKGNIILSIIMKGSG
ncbi:MAG: hypothetical protein HY739_09540 [Desulfobacterales bacterium]|nr:hypothetical protein [Desulfobacterales bacterium]